MAKFKVGDKVRIREDLEVDKFYGDCQFIYEMENLKGEIVTIEEVLKRGYLIKEYYYLWSEEMLEEVKEEFSEDDIDLAKIIIDECIKEKELREKNKTKKTFRELIIDGIKPGEIWENKDQRISRIYLNKYGNLQLEGEDNSFAQNYSTCIGFEATYELKRKEYTFEEAFKAYEEGKEIESVHSGYRYKLKDKEDLYISKIIEEWVENTEFDLDEIRGKWYIND